MLKNEDGADFLPMRLAAVMVAASVALAFAATYAMALIDRSSVAAARASAAGIVGVAAAEYAEGCPGSGDGVLIGVSVPGNVLMIEFGTMPAGGAPIGGTQNAAGVYTIHYIGGNNETYFSGVPLGMDSPDQACGGPFVLYPGRYTVRIRIQLVNGSVMALIDPEAA